MLDSKSLGRRLRALRTSRGLSQRELAQRAGIARSSVIDLEQGKQTLELRTLIAALNALRHDLDLVSDVRPSEILAERKQDMLQAAAAHRISDVRVFGSTARGDDDRESDIDLLVHTPDDMHPGELAAFEAEIERLTGIDVDVLSDKLAGAKYDEIRASAVPL